MPRRKSPGTKRPQTPAQAAATRRNLKPIKKGEVRNPTGINGTDWLAEFRRFANGHEQDSKGNKILRIEAVRKALFYGAIKGKEKSQMFILEQLQGKAVQQIHISGPGGGPIETDNVNVEGRIDPRTMTTLARRARVNALIEKAVAAKAAADQKAAEEASKPATPVEG